MELVQSHYDYASVGGLQVAPPQGMLQSMSTASVAAGGPSKRGLIPPSAAVNSPTTGFHPHGRVLTIFLELVQISTLLNKPVRLLKALCTQLGSV